MIALTLVIVLVAIAIPSYGNYTRRVMATEGLVLAEPTMLKVREEVIYQDSLVSEEGLNSANPPSGAAFAPAPPVQGPNLSENVKSVVRHGVNVIINYTRKFDPKGETEYSLLMLANNDGVNWKCKSGPHASSALHAAASDGVVVGEPLPTKWAPKNC